MAGMSKKVTARFYRSPTGREPVRDWLLAMTNVDRKIVGQDIATVEFGWPIGMPTCRPLGNGLYEVRSHLSERRIARVLFGFEASEIVLVHAFIKKTQKTPRAELELAQARLGEMS